MRYFYLLFAILSICCLFACEKGNDSAEAYERPVVEAYLIPGKAVLVKVYYQKYLEDTISYGFPITGLKLKISDGSKSVELTESKAGNYVFEDTAFVADKKSYALSFEYNNKTISAQTTVPDKPDGFSSSAVEQYLPDFRIDSPETFVPVTFNWNNPSSAYFVMVFKNIDKYPQQISGRFSILYRDTEVMLGQVNTYETQRMQFNFLGNYRVLLFHVNKEYRDALNNNGGSSLNLTTPATNIVNGLGIFTAMQADTVSLHVYE